jgi:hypothetical protein
MKKQLRLISLIWAFSLLMPLAAFAANTTITVDIWSLTLPAHSLPDLNLPELQRTDFALLPFYFQINYSQQDQQNWGVDLYTNNRSQLGTAVTPDGIYRGLRGISDPSVNAPMLWQVYGYDLQVPQSWGTPYSVTSTVGGLALNENTLGYWGRIYDQSDRDQLASWDQNRPSRMVVNIDQLGMYPSSGRRQNTSPVFLYFGLDMRQATPQNYVGDIVLEIYKTSFDYSQGGYATPNPVKPVLGQKVYFNFFTNSPDAQIKIKIIDITGGLVRTLTATRYWDCRNSAGSWVEGGIYLYQIEAEGHRISGTVVVIK